MKTLRLWSMITAAMLSGIHLAAADAVDPEEAHKDHGTVTAVGKQHVLRPKLRSRIGMGSLFSRFYVVRLAFNPDSRYLAVGDAGSATIVIRDLQRDTEQSRFEVAHLADDRRGGSGHLHWYHNEEIIWSPDGRLVTTGIGRAQAHGNDPLLPIEFWDPMTGKLANVLDAYSFNSGEFNRDGSKFLTVWSRGAFSIYDSRTWQGSELPDQPFKFDTGMPVTEVYGWTADDKVLMVGSWSGQLKDRPMPPFESGKIPRTFSQIIQKIDPTGKEPTQIEVLGDPSPTNDPNRPFGPPFLCHEMVVSHAGHRAAISCADGIRVLNTDTLRTLFVYHPPVGSQIAPGFGMALSPDGQHLYLLARDSHDKEVQSRIIDATTGEEVGTFPSADSWGLAISPDGKTMAVGHRSYVELYDLQ